MNYPHKHETPLTTAVRRGVWALTSLAVPGWALAAPQGGQVVVGSASIAQQGTKTTITQSTAKGAINWQSFSIGAKEYVQFVQPGTTSVTLNRVVGNNPSQLLGQMSANGQVFLVNPNGIYFGPNAVIDVAGLLATTFDISNEDFMAGRYEFARMEGRDPASVVNDGTITTEGGYVILAGDGVENHGLIEARLGDIVMSASERINLDLGGDGLISYSIDGEALTEIAGVENTGALYADGGRVFMTAKVQGDLLTTAVNHEGLIRARKVEEQGGIVYLGGSGGDVILAGDVDADGGEFNTDGGKILVGSTNDITVSGGAVLSAEGSGSGNGGMVRLIAKEDLNVEANTTITTEGGATGQGGFIEVSGHAGLTLRGDVRGGAGGEVLIDPSTLVIVGGSTGGTGSALVYETSIEAKLNAGTDVTLIASDLITVQNVPGNFGSLGTGTNQVIGSRGSGDLTLAIGTVASSGGSLTLGDDGLNSCPIVGLCIGGSQYRFAPDSSGSIIMHDGSGNYVGIDVFGHLTLSAGTDSGIIDINNVRSKKITINSDIRYEISDSTNPAFLFISAFTGSANINGDLLVSNPLGDARIQINGKPINIDASIYAFAGNGGEARIGMNAGSTGSNQVINWNSGNIVAADTLFGDDCLTGSCFGLGSVNSISGVTMPTFPLGSGTAWIQIITGQEINLNAPFEYNASNLLNVDGFMGAFGGGDALVSIRSVGDGIYQGSSLAAGPMIYAEAGSIGPNWPRVSLQAASTIDIWHSKTPIIENTEAHYYSIQTNAEGAQNSQITLSASAINVNGHLQANASVGAAYVQLASRGAGGIAIGSSGLILASGNAANATISASNSAGATGLINIEGDIKSIGRGNAQINVDNQGAGGIRLRGSLLASAEFFTAQARFFSSGGTVDLGGTVRAIAPNFAMVDAITFINSNRMIIDGQLTAQAETNPYLYLFHQGTDFSIGSNALIESKSPTGAQADMDIAFGGAINVQSGALISAGSSLQIISQSLQLDGTLRASHTSGDAAIKIRNGTGSVNVGNTGLIQVLGGTGSGTHQVLIGSGTTAYSDVQVDGVIEAVGGGSRSLIFINAEGINVAAGGRVSAINTAGSLSSIQLRSFGSGGIVAPGVLQANQLLGTNINGGGIQITNPIIDGINLATIGSGSTGIVYTDPDLVQINQLRSDNGDIVIDAGLITIGGSILANGPDDVILRSASDIVFGGFNQVISGDAVVLDASFGGSVISPTTNTITANALSVLAANSIDLGFTSIIVNNGIPSLASYQFGDALMLSELTSLGVTVPSVPIGNAAFRALDINLGTFDFFGDYLYLQADQITLNSAIGTWLPGTEPTPGTINPEVIVQMQPYTPTQAIAIESLMPSSQLTGTTYFTQADHFSRFPGTSLLLGGASYTGPMQIGQDGMVNIGTKNFLAFTSGTVTGSGNIMTSPPGLVSVIGGAPVSPPPTPPSSTTTSTSTSNSTSTTLTSTEVVTTFVQQTTRSDPTSPTETGGSTITEEAVEMNLPVEEAVAGITPSEEETASGTPAGNEPTIESSEDAVAGTPPPEEETASGTEADDESAIELFSDEPIDMVAALEQQPLVETYLEVNGITLACQ
jgi:filamentous hemagglutinin family protein